MNCCSTVTTSQELQLASVSKEVFYRPPTQRCEHTNCFSTATTGAITVSKGQEKQLTELTISAFLPWPTQTYLPDHETKEKNHLLNHYCLQKIQASETKQFLYNVSNWKEIFWRHWNFSLGNFISSKSVYHSFKQPERGKLTLQVKSLIKPQINYSKCLISITVHHLCNQFH